MYILYINIYFVYSTGSYTQYLLKPIMEENVKKSICIYRQMCPWGFSRQEYWSGLPFPSPGDLPNPGIKPKSPALQVDSLPSELPGKPKNTGVGCHSLLQWIFPTQELNWCQLHCRWILYQPYQGSPDKHNGRECEKRICIYIQIDISLIAQLVKNLPAMQETPVGFLGQEDLLEKGQATHSNILADKESTCNMGDLGLIPGLGRSPGEGKGYPLQYSGLENSMDSIVMGSQRVGHD